MKPIVLVPTYNNPETVGSVLRSVAAQGVACMAVNDGSAEPTRRVLDECADELTQLSVVHLNRNGGKGEALKHGFQEAFRQGFTHAVTIDADGQHQVDDLHRFLDCARQNPDALILGEPIYGDDAPRSRVIGRKFTMFWIHLETFCDAIADALLGYRCYPLAPVCDLMRKCRLGSRMEFEPEIAVRLFWEGVPIRNLKTRVVYPPGGVSHFDMLWDNLRLTRMHTGLVFAIPAHLPKLLKLRKRREQTRVEQ